MVQPQNAAKTRTSTIYGLVQSVHCCFCCLWTLHMTKNWGNKQNLAFQRGFKDKGWDPHLTDGKKIRQTVINEPDIFAEVKPWFSQKDGGTKSNNNTIYTHFKTQASEYITLLAKIGIRRSMSTAVIYYGWLPLIH